MPVERTLSPARSCLRAGETANDLGRKCPRLGPVSGSDGKNATDRRPLSGRTSREDEVEETGSRGNDTIKGKQRSVASKKHSGRRAALHNRGKKIGEATTKIKRTRSILKKRGGTARREAEKVKEWGTRLDYDAAAARWKEEVEEAQSVADGTHPKLAGLEAEELTKRKERFKGAPLGNLTYDRVGGTFRFIMNQMDNLSTRKTRDIKIRQLTD